MPRLYFVYNLAVQKRFSLNRFDIQQQLHGYELDRINYTWKSYHLERRDVQCMDANFG
ncbi:hypothetical protein [Draconibacterium halophilum]|uniref:Uncharacterized protein n=1 Tax=Draconibacterium halophilum TaxID=2706887 RepID=A0A6C0RHC0_9BACT|nr:hypothetical protein [Draconibacterium halophilum]QIA09065.1 hypothetical protein G0Q07_15690 [Draconibacterium halophilum]